MSTKRVLSGVRATGALHLGNYLGAIRQWVASQGDASDGYYFIADLHGLTEITDEHDRERFREQRIRTAASFLASGLDPARVTLFLQSDIEQHTGLFWLLASVARKGELERMTQWKDKGGLTGAGASAGLFTYPVLMAADILLYDTDEVPVGEDQQQHVEAARDWAQRFNSYFGETFVMPRAVVPPQGARVMDLVRPTSKMSKSSASHDGVILLDDSPDTIRQKVRRATTDSDTAIRRSREKPGISNLVNVLAAVSRRPAEAVEDDYTGLSYARLKDDVADALVAELEPIRLRFTALLADPAELARLLAIGAERAGTVAEKTLARAHDALGLGAL